MELPISVIVVLFVAVVVGGVIINFSQQNLLRAEEGLNDRLRIEDVPDDQIMQLVDVTPQTVISLAEECIARNGATPEEAICFAIFAETFQDLSGVDGTNLSNGWPINTSSVATDIQAIRIIYDPRGVIRVTS